MKALVSKYEALATRLAALVEAIDDNWSDLESMDLSQLSQAEEDLYFETRATRAKYAAELERIETKLEVAREIASETSGEANDVDTVILYEIVVTSAITSENRACIEDGTVTSRLSQTFTSKQQAELAMAEINSGRYDNVATDSHGGAARRVIRAKWADDHGYGVNCLTGPTAASKAVQDVEWFFNCRARKTGTEV